MYTSTGPVQYDRLCIALGARPNVLYPGLSNVFGIRDTHSVQHFNVSFVLFVVFNVSFIVLEII